MSCIEKLILGCEVLLFRKEKRHSFKMLKRDQYTWHSKDMILLHLWCICHSNSQSQSASWVPSWPLGIGTMHRTMQVTSPFGKFLDPVADKLLACSATRLEEDTGFWWVNRPGRPPYLITHPCGRCRVALGGGIL